MCNGNPTDMWQNIRDTLPELTFWPTQKYIFKTACQFIKYSKCRDGKHLCSTCRKTSTLWFLKSSVRLLVKPFLMCSGLCYSWCWSESALHREHMLAFDLLESGRRLSVCVCVLKWVSKDPFWDFKGSSDFLSLKCDRKTDYLWQRSELMLWLWFFRCTLVIINL